MFLARHLQHSSASADRVFALVVDPAAWSRWDPDVQSAHLDGPPIPGVSGRVQPAKGPAARFVLLEVDPGRRVLHELRLPLARVRFDHRYQPVQNGGTTMTHEIQIRGPLTPVFARLLGKPAARGLPEAMRRLADLAEHHDGESDPSIEHS